jgi:ribosomal protein S1
MGIPDWNWPAYKNDKERIKALSRRYKNITIKDAFANEYSLNLDHVQEPTNLIPAEPKVGQIVEVMITHIDKNKITFDSINLKTDMISKVNLYQYDFFKKYLPTDPVKVVVTDVDKYKVTVDPIMPLMDGWLVKQISSKVYQRQLRNPKPVTVRNLQLTRGGFIGDVVVDDISEFIHEEYTIPAFIPGSQIVLNIAEDFEAYIGKDVQAFVINYNKKAGNHVSMICSAKEYLKHLGDVNMIDMFNSWCDGTEYWKSVEETTYNGIVTGIINSSKKSGVFVEIPELSITGLISMSPDELVNYQPRQEIFVKIAGFDEETFYNPTMKQMQHVEPYVIKDGALEKCNLRPILKLA